ncbi:hypothetical protein OTU49_010251 [Cherax quadricarinatus]|uniref:ATP-dependent RNA helicase n=1 Tax=Cherax quadricarinatus TaxID=27406 RepID=A0AAW0W934_CHEQU
MDRQKHPNKKPRFKTIKEHKFEKKKKKNEREKEEINNLKNKKKELGEINPDEIQSFAKLPLSKRTLKGLKDSNYLVPTKIQRHSLVFSLRGFDVVAAAKTGFGKTLAFIIPLLEMLYCKRWSPMDGLGVLVITPTRELAYQIFEVLKKVGKEHDFSAGLVIGGKDLKFEWNRVSSCNILICTPGRILQHMTENPEFVADNVQMLILDEADQCLSMGFADTMNCIFEELSCERQTLLFSATQTRDVKDLIRAGCKNPVFCSVHEHSKTSTPKSLHESYVVCDAHEKFTFLWSFIRHHRKYKILVFLATCKQVQYMFNMFCKLHPGLSVMSLRGSMHQLRRMAVYDDFCKKKTAVLFATDVAARGLDIPAVDWVVQVDCPEDVTTYIHRVGRTARCSRSGRAILVLMPSEEKAMVADLRAKNIPIEKIDVDSSKLQRINIKIEIILSKYLNLKEEAVRAFKTYLKHLALTKDKKVFNIMSIDINAFARSLGLVVTPRVRFLEKGMKTALGQMAVKSETNEAEQVSDLAERPKLTTLDIGAGDSDEDDDDDFLKISEHQDEFTDDDEMIMKSTDSRTNRKKPITKFDIVKKLKRKNLQVNQRVIFDDEMLLDPTYQQADNKQIYGGIDITRFQDIMKEEDHLDKKLNATKLKEKRWLKKRKAKAKSTENKEDEKEEAEEQDESDDDIDEFTQTIIDELPDPDKYYNSDKVEESNDDFDDKESDSEESMSEEGINRLKRRKAKTKFTKNQENKKEEQQQYEDYDDNESTQKIIDKLPDPGKHFNNDKVEESSDDDSVEESDSEESMFEEKTAKVSGKRRARDRARESKRARLAQMNTLEALPMDEQEELALFLLRGKRP